MRQLKMPGPLILSGLPLKRLPGRLRKILLLQKYAEQELKMRPGLPLKMRPVLPLKMPEPLMRCRLLLKMRPGRLARILPAQAQKKLSLLILSEPVRKMPSLLQKRMLAGLPLKRP